MANLSSAANYGRAVKNSWTLTDADATGERLNSPGNPDRCVQVAGTFNGGSLTIQGSNDDTNWATLHDATGADLVFTAAGLRSVMEGPLFIRPVLSGASAGASVTVAMSSRSS